jgi:phosphoribosylanthranilate isomerase
MTIVKICGLTNVDDACFAAGAGADLLGFIFYPKSPRYVTPERAANIVRAVREATGNRALRCVGVFVNEPVAHVRAVRRVAGLDLVQLHGDEPLGEVQQLRGAFKAIRPETIEQARAQAAVYARPASAGDMMPQLMVDAHAPHRFGGTGVPVDLDIARDLSQRFDVLLAGGLTPETVAAVVEQVRPWGVDVSSGVESDKGIKDHARVAALIQAVRTVDAAADDGLA